MSLVEQSDNLVTLLEPRNLGANLDNLSCTIGGGNHWEVEWERVEALESRHLCQYLSEAAHRGLDGLPSEW